METRKARQISPDLSPRLHPPTPQTNGCFRAFLETLAVALYLPLSHGAGFLSAYPAKLTHRLPAGRSNHFQLTDDVSVNTAGRVERPPHPPAPPTLSLVNKAVLLVKATPGRITVPKAFSSCWLILMFVCVCVCVCVCTRTCTGVCSCVC